MWFSGEFNHKEPKEKKEWSETTRNWIMTILLDSLCVIEIIKLIEMFKNG